MLKRTMLAACVAAMALAGLPGVAEATYADPYLAEEGEPIEEVGFTVSGGETSLRDTSGRFVECTQITGNGEFSNEETGEIRFIFKGCKTVFGLSCTTSGEPTGTVVSTTLPFHLKTVDHGGQQTPGVLITPGAGESAHEGSHFATSLCSFAGKTEVGGNGLVGTITTPEEKSPANTATVAFQKEPAKPGHQTHRTVTNDNKETVEYDLKSSFNGDTTATTSLDAHTTLTFANGTEPEIRTTEE